MSDQHWTPRADFKARVTDETTSRYGEICLVTSIYGNFTFVRYADGISDIMHPTDLDDPDAPFPDDDCADDTDCLGDTAAFTRDEQGGAS